MTCQIGLDSTLPSRWVRDRAPPSSGTLQGHCIHRWLKIQQILLHALLQVLVYELEQALYLLQQVL